jgi:hypothetical protein
VNATEACPSLSDTIRAGCGSTVDVVLHHLRYDWPLGDGPDEALMPLCRRHHLEVHQLHAKRPHRDLERDTLGFLPWAASLP